MRVFAHPEEMADKFVVQFQKHKFKVSIVQNVLRQVQPLYLPENCAWTFNDILRRIQR
jgi:hypothetical protein